MFLLKHLSKRVDDVHLEGLVEPLALVVYLHLEFELGADPHKFTVLLLEDVVATIAEEGHHG